MESPSPVARVDLDDNQQLKIDKIDLTDWASIVSKPPSFFLHFFLLPFNVEWLFSLSYYGGMDSISNKLYNVRMSLDARSDELPAIEKGRKTMLDQAMWLLFMNSLIGTLIFCSLLWVSFYPIMTSEDSIKYFKKDICDIFYRVYIACTYGAMALSMAQVIYSLQMYHVLSYWMPTIELKFEFLNDAPVYYVILMTSISIILAAMGFPFAIAISIDPTAGLYAVVAVGLFLLFLLHLQRVIVMSIRRVHEYVRNYFVKQSLINRNDNRDSLQRKVTKSTSGSNNHRRNLADSRRFQYRSPKKSDPNTATNNDGGDEDM